MQAIGKRIRSNSSHKPLHISKGIYPCKDFLFDLEK
jgi:hypothetical protein